MPLREQCSFYLSLYHRANGLFQAHQELKGRMGGNLCEEGPCLSGF